MIQCEKPSKSLWKAKLKFPALFTNNAHTTNNENVICCYIFQKVLQNTDFGNQPCVMSQIPNPAGSWLHPPKLLFIPFHTCGDLKRF